MKLFQIRTPEQKTSYSRRSHIVGILEQKFKSRGLELRLTLRESWYTAKKGRYKEANLKRARRIARLMVEILNALTDLGYKVIEIKESAYSRCQTEKRKKNLVDKLIEEMIK